MEKGQWGMEPAKLDGRQIGLLVSRFVGGVDVRADHLDPTESGRVPK